MNQQIRGTFAAQLQNIYGNPKLSQEEIDKYSSEQIEKQERKKAQKKRQQNLQQLKTLNREQKQEIVNYCRNDAILIERMKNILLKETEIGQLIKKKLQAQRIQSMGDQIQQFRNKMTLKLQKIFLSHQNQLIGKLKQLLDEKSNLFLQILDIKIQNLMSVDTRQYIKTILNHELEEQSKLLINQMSQQFTHYYDQIFIVLFQHIKSIRNERDLSLQKCITQLKDSIKIIEQEYLKRLQVDINQIYVKCINEVIKNQQVIRQYLE